MLQDLAILTDGQVVTEETGLVFENITLNELGLASRVVAEPRAITFVGGGGRNRGVRSRIAQIRRWMETAPEEMQAWLQQRLAALAGGVAVIRVSGSSREQIRLRRNRAEGVLQAVRTAAAEGVVPGGGVALLRAADAVDPSSASTRDRAAGMKLVQASMAVPLHRMAENAWANGDAVVARVRQSTGAFGFDARAREFVDLDQAGLRDPALTLRRAVEEASAFSRLVLTTGVAVA